MMGNCIHNSHETYSRNRAGERGWALLGLLLALAILSIVLVSTVVPSVRFQVRRDKEAEMMYRGEQMAEAIARYYGRGRLQVLSFRTPPPPYGYLIELDKLIKGVNDGPIEKRFVRISAMTDPLANAEWEPVRVGDPRIAVALNIYAAQPDTFIPQSYWELAGPPSPTISIPGSSGGSESPDGTEGSEGGSGSGSAAGGGGASGSVSGTSTSVPSTGQPQATPQPRPTTPPRNNNQNNQQTNPLDQFFRDGADINSRPIVGVIPSLKGASIRSYKGVLNYEEMVFIYLPNQREMERLIQEQQRNQQNNQNPRTRPGGNPGRLPNRNPGGASSTRDP